MIPILNNANGVSGDVFSLNLENNIVHLFGDITDLTAASVVAQLLQLDAKLNGKGLIQLYINSPGGSVSAGMAIYDTIKYLKTEVSTVCIGMAASMAAVILSGGTKGKRVILPHAEVMIHQPLGGISGQATDILITADHIKETRSMLNEILAENCGKPVEVIATDVERDNWMRGAKAVEYGICDKVLA